MYLCACNCVCVCLCVSVSVCNFLRLLCLALAAFENHVASASCRGLSAASSEDVASRFSGRGSSVPPFQCPSPSRVFPSFFGIMQYGEDVRRLHLMLMCDRRQPVAHHIVALFRTNSLSHLLTLSHSHSPPLSLSHSLSLLRCYCP